MSTIHSQEIGPGDLSPTTEQALEKLLAHEVRPVLISPSGDVLELDKALNDLLVLVAETVANRRTSVTIIPGDETFTTQAAAEFLRVSRQFVVLELEAGKIPFHKVGTHRRIRFSDLLAYQQAHKGRARKALDAMTKEVVEADYDSRLLPEAASA